MFTRRNSRTLKGFKTALLAETDQNEHVSEREFNQILVSNSITTIRSPVALFTDHVTDERLIFLYDAKIDTQAIYFLILEELRLLITSADSSGELFMANLIQMIKRRNLKSFYTGLTKKLNQIKQKTTDLKFVPPVGLLLHKEGQNLSSVVIRQCQIANEYFGQSLHKGGTHSYKYNYFKDQYVSIENKQMVEDRLNTISKMRANVLQSIIFPWPDKKETAECFSRKLPPKDLELYTADQSLRLNLLKTTRSAKGCSSVILIYLI